MNQCMDTVAIDMRNVINNIIIIIVCDDYVPGFV